MQVENLFLGNKHVEEIRVLQQVPLFQNFTPDQIASLAGLCTQQQYPPGSLVIEENQPANALYVIMEGQVTVNSRYWQGPGRIFGPNGHFGEMALLTGEPSSVSVTVNLDQKVTLLVLGKDLFDRYLVGNLSAMQTLLKEMTQRIAEANALIFEEPTVDKT